MASIIDINDRRRRRSDAASGSARAASGKIVVCIFCSERHPIVRLRTGESRCVTAFFDGRHWFCLNRGCRRAWLDGRAK